MNTPHPELEALAELADPAEPTPRAEELVAHVESCDQCKADVAALRGVRHSLRSLPPVHMPDDVAARLELAIRAAAAAGPAAEPGGSVSVLPAREHETAGHRDHWFSHFSAAAAVAVLVVVALGTGIGVTISRGGPSHGRAASDNAAGPAGGAVVIASGSDYQPASIRNQIAALVLARVPQAPRQYNGLHSLANKFSAAASSAGSAAAAGSRPAAADGGAPSAVPTTTGQERSQSTASAPRAVGAPRTAASGPLADPAALQACVLALVQKPETPVLVDYANYQGKPATIIVLADPTTPTTLDVYVEADTADCAKSGDVTFVTFLPAAS